MSVTLGPDGLRLTGPREAATPQLKESMAQEKAGVRAILEAEAEFMALYRKVDALTEPGATPEQRAEAEHLIHGALFEVRQRYLELAGLL